MLSSESVNYILLFITKNKLQVHLELHCINIVNKMKLPQGCFLFSQWRKCDDVSCPAEPRVLPSAQRRLDHKTQTQHIKSELSVHVHLLNIPIFYFVHTVWQHHIYVGYSTVCNFSVKSCDTFKPKMLCFFELHCSIRWKYPTCLMHRFTHFPAFLAWHSCSTGC